MGDLLSRFEDLRLLEDFLEDIAKRYGNKYL
jgi:hypothetical protein